ncbi:MAG: hemolysin family protein [Treponema sp.]|jgi:CBS domain containing-hemolysin-like protein|nr:hemolysin family protein [Treponema sp.]
MSSGFIDGVTGGLSRFFKKSGPSKTGSSPAKQESRNTQPGRKGAETPPRIDQKTIRALESDKKEMILGIVELSDTTVKEVMVPRTDMVFLSVDDSRDELLACIAESEHSRFPVFEETIDNVIGVLYVKDVLRSLVKEEPFDVRKLLRKPFFVPVSMHIDRLLRELRRRKVHIAVIVDEYGGVSGIVCMEDIIEEIVGDIQDEFDHETEDILKLGEGTWLCDARVNLEDLSRELGLELPVEDFDTLGGFVFDLFGKIPVRYEKATYQGDNFIIQEMDGHKINSVKIILKKEEEAS